MSTIVAVRKDGWVAIGADTLTKFGSVRQSTDYLRNYGKILRVGENYLAYVGDCAFSMIIPHYFAKLKQVPAMDSPLAIFDMLVGMHKSLKEDYFLRPEEDEEDDFESSRTQMLVVNIHGIFGIYTLRSVDEFDRFFAFGTGYKFALGAMKTVYDTTASAEEIARAGLEAAAEFDDSTGSPLEVYTLKLA